jgi:hypothetical protein
MTTSEDRSSDTTPLAGRVDAAAGAAFASAADLAGAMRRASAAHGEHEKRIGAADPDWYAANIRNLPG